MVLQMDQWHLESVQKCHELAMSAGGRKSGVMRQVNKETSNARVASGLERVASSVECP